MSKLFNFEQKRVKDKQTAEFLSKNVNNQLTFTKQLNYWTKRPVLPQCDRCEQCEICQICDKSS